MGFFHHYHYLIESQHQPNGTLENTSLVAWDFWVENSPPLVRSPRFGCYLEVSHFGLFELREMTLPSTILGGRKQSARQHLAKCFRLCKNQVG